MLYRLPLVFAMGVVGALTLFGIQVPPEPVNQTVSTIVYYFRLLPGFIGMILALAGGYMMYRVTRYNKTLEASENTVKIYKEQLEATNSRLLQIGQDHKLATEQLIAAQLEAKELRNRTDLTEVLKVQHQLLEMKQVHDRDISETLKSAIDRGQKQYGDLMTTLEKTLNYLSEQSRSNSKVAEQNHELLVGVSGMINRIADKLTGVETTVGTTKTTLTDVQQTVNDINDVVNHEPDPEPERRGRGRDRESRR